MKKELTHISVWKTGIMLGTILAVIMLTASAIFSLCAKGMDIWTILLPALYGITGMLMGMLGASTYNAMAAWIGGIQYHTHIVEDYSGREEPKQPPQQPTPTGFEQGWQAGQSSSQHNKPQNPPKS